MAKKKISELPVATPLEGGELLPLVQEGTTKHSTVTNFVDFASTLIGADIINDHLTAPDPHPQYVTDAEAPALAPVQSVNGATGTVVLDKSSVGLGNVDNTSDASKPVSTATQTALDGKEPVFPKGNLVQGAGVSLTGTLTGRLVGTGDVTITSVASGGITWTVTATPVTVASGDAKLVTAAVDITLPASVATGDQFLVHAKVTGVRVVSNGNTITGVGAGNNITMTAGESVWLVASAANTLEIV